MSPHVTCLDSALLVGFFTLSRTAGDFWEAADFWEAGEDPGLVFAVRPMLTEPTRPNKL